MVWVIDSPGVSVPQLMLLHDWVPSMLLKISTFIEVIVPPELIDRDEITTPEINVLDDMIVRNNPVATRAIRVPIGSFLCATFNLHNHRCFEYEVLSINKYCCCGELHKYNRQN